VVGLPELGAVELAAPAQGTEGQGAIAFTTAALTAPLPAVTSWCRPTNGETVTPLTILLGTVAL